MIVCFCSSQIGKAPAKNTRNSSLKCFKFTFDHVVAFGGLSEWKWNENSHSDRNYFALKGCFRLKVIIVD